MMRRSFILGLLLACTACSTYTAIYEQEAVPNKSSPVVRGPHGEAVHENPAGFTVTASVPVGGTEQVSMGPPCLPIIPWRKVRPFPLTVDIHVVAKDPQAQIVLRPALWTARTRSDDLDERSRREIIQTHEVAMAQRLTDDSEYGNPEIVSGDTVTARGELRLRLTFGGAWDSEFFAFAINGKLRTAGTEHTLPALSFERGSRGSYDAYTTQFLEVL